MIKSNEYKYFECKFKERCRNNPYKWYSTFDLLAMYDEDEDMRPGISTIRSYVQRLISEDRVYVKREKIWFGKSRKTINLIRWKDDA